MEKAGSKPSEGSESVALQKKITRSLICKLLKDPRIVALPTISEQRVALVELLKEHLRLPNTQSSFERCWSALDLFLLGHTEIDQVPFNESFSSAIRTINFCLDLFQDYASKKITVQKYLSTRHTLLNPERKDNPITGIYRLQTNHFGSSVVNLQQENGPVIKVDVDISLGPRRVYAKKLGSIKTAFGHLIKAEVAQQGVHVLGKVFLLTGSKVVLKYSNKQKVCSSATCAKEDPFKEIAVLKALRGTVGFPHYLDVLENDVYIVKVESDCGTSLYEVATASVTK